MNIVIVGAGWYGMYLAKKLSDKGECNSITVIEREHDIFVNNASRHNQCRLHLGFHYPRSHETRTLCQLGFTRFMEEFPHLTYEIPNNWYVISEDSFLDYESYNAIFAYHATETSTTETTSAVSNPTASASTAFSASHTLLQTTTVSTANVLQKVDANKAIVVQERGINPHLAAEYFRNLLKDKVTFLFGHHVTGISEDCVRGIVSEKEFAQPFDFCFDCTNFQVLKPPNVVFEQTITMLYRKKQDAVVPFGALTVMDGPFFSLFPYEPDTQIYTLTHVKYSVLSSTENDVAVVRELMEADVLQYYPAFLDSFEYVSFFKSPKTKPLSKSDSRRLMVERRQEGDKPKRVVAVSCGKITGIFQMFEELFPC